MENRQQVLQRLRTLLQEHEAAVGEGPGQAPGFIEDEMVTRNSYELVVREGLDSGAITRADLETEGLPVAMDGPGQGR